MKTLCWKLAGLSTCATWRHIYVNQQVTFPRLGLLNDYGLAEGAVLTDFRDVSGEDIYGDEDECDGCAKSRWLGHAPRRGSREGT